ASGASQQYLFARLEADVILEFVRVDGEAPEDQSEAIGASAHRSRVRTVFHVWPDFEIHPLIMTSISTVKADAAWASFSAFGSGIVWAVLDSGIDGEHPHFSAHKNLKPAPPL